MSVARHISPKASNRFHPNDFFHSQLQTGRQKCVGQDSVRRYPKDLPSLVYRPVSQSSTALEVTIRLT